MKKLLKVGVTALVLGLVSWSCQKTQDSAPTPTPDPYTAADRMPVFYEANPTVFATDGCLKAIENRLDEIQKLGTDVLWIMPIYPRGQKYSHNSPYCIKDFKAVDPKCGTMADLKSLVDAAHAKGMKVILDWVANHTSFDNAWVTEHKDWYTFNDYGDPVSPDGWDDVAELNYEIKDEDDKAQANQALYTAMKDAMIYWMDNAGVDGFRCDFAEGVPMDFWKNAITAIRAKKADAIMLAETASVDYLNAGFDYIYGWTYKSALKALFDGGPAAYFDAALSMEYDPLPAGKHYVRFTTNHDQAAEEKAGEEFVNVQGKLAAFAVTAFVGESPLIYSSQEVGYASSLNFMEDHVIEWSKAAEYTAKYEEIMKIYTDYAAIRRGRPGFLATQDILTMRYVNGEKEFVLLVNTGKEAKENAKMAIELVGNTYTDVLNDVETTFGEVMAFNAFEYKIFVK